MARKGEDREVEVLYFKRKNDTTIIVNYNGVFYAVDEMDLKPVFGRTYLILRSKLLIDNIVLPD